MEVRVRHQHQLLPHGPRLEHKGAAADRLHPPRFAFFSTVDILFLRDREGGVGDQLKEDAGRLGQGHFKGIIVQHFGTREAHEFALLAGACFGIAHHIF